MRRSTAVPSHLIQYGGLFRVGVFFHLCVVGIALGAPTLLHAQGDSADQKEPPAVFKIENELITEQEVKDFKQDDFNFKTALRQGNLSNNDQQLIAKGIRVRIHSLTLKRIIADKEAGKKIVEDLRRAINDAGLSLPQSAVQRFREFVLKEVLDRCTELLDNQFTPRTQAVALLANMSLVEADPIRGGEEVAYSPAFKPLMDVLNEPGQLDGIKIIAIRGLMRINLKGSTPPSPNDRIGMGQSLIRELARDDTIGWYQEVLLEALGTIDQVRDLAGQPFIVQAIESVLNDRERKWTVRAAAAKALGRAQLTVDMPVDRYVVGIVNLARESAETVNNGKGENSPEWKRCFADIFFAFQPEESETDARVAGLMEKVKQPGMAKFQKIVNDGYKQSLPLVNHVVASGNDGISQFPDTMIEPVLEWLQTNAPADYPLNQPNAATKQAQGDSPRPPG